MSFPTFLLLHLHHSSFSNPSVASPTSQIILQPFHDFTYVTAHSQPFYRLTYITGTSSTSLGELPMLINIVCNSLNHLSAKRKFRFIPWNCLCRLHRLKHDLYEICIQSVANPDQYFRYTASFICHNFAYNCNGCIAFHLSIILITTKFTGMIAPFDRIKNLFI